MEDPLWGMAFQGTWAVVVYVYTIASLTRQSQHVLQTTHWPFPVNKLMRSDSLLPRVYSDDPLPNNTV